MGKLLRLISILVCLLPLHAFAEVGADLVVNADGIVIYSGPSTKFRPLFTASKGDKFPVSVQRVPGINETGEFYKILVTLRPGNRKRLGYISRTVDVQIQPSNNDEHVDLYKDLALLKKALQLGFAGLEYKTYQMTVGYLVYPLPDLYFKPFAGQVLKVTQGAVVAGLEAGLDHFIAGPFSFYVSAAAGAAFASQGDVLFAGSSTVNAIAQAGAGIRYAAGAEAAVSLGLLNSTYFNQSAGIFLIGGLLTVEVGL